MKTVQEEYEFSKSEIRILKELTKGERSLSEIEKSLPTKPPLLSYNLKKLLRKGIINETAKGFRKHIEYTAIRPSTPAGNRAPDTQQPFHPSTTSPPHTQHQSSFKKTAQKRGIAGDFSMLFGVQLISPEFFYQLVLISKLFLTKNLDLCIFYNSNNNSCC